VRTFRLDTSSVHPSFRGTTLCVNPFPNDRSPTNLAPLLSRSAAASSSDVEAVWRFMRMRTGVERGSSGWALERGTGSLKPARSVTLLRRLRLIACVDG